MEAISQAKRLWINTNAGVAGADQADGADEADGAAGADQADGADEADGAAGADQADGADEADGAAGAAGADEANGAAGADQADGALRPMEPLVLLDIWSPFQLISRRAHLPIPSGFN